MKTTLLCLLLLFVSSGVSQLVGAPPPWAPAHGYRAKYTYRYFPQQEVYQRTNDGVWFYYNDGKWAFGAELPIGIKVDVRSAVSLEMDSDAPYRFHAEVKAAYPRSNGVGGDKGPSAGESAKPGKGKKKH